MENNYAYNRIEEEFKSDEFFGFNEDEIKTIGFKTNPTLSPETFKEARHLFRNNPDAFKERFGFIPSKN